MKLTRIIAAGIILGSVVLLASPPGAQTLRDAQPPAEFPPASYKGRQYVDSRGCIYVRAGVDGRVTWVPRVTRNRKQLCGYKPTAVAGTTARPVRTGPAPVEITIAPSARPAAPARTATAPAKARPAPAGRKAATAPKVRTQTRAPTRTVRAPAAAVRVPAAGTAAPYRGTGAARVVVPAPSARRTTTARPPATAPATAPVRTKPAPAIAPRRATTPTCPNASPFSQQFINKKGVRCGPQAEPPVSYITGALRGPAAAEALPPDTVVIPRHVYELRHNTTNLSVPAGYRTVWKDGRLNPRRAERSLRPAVIRDRAVVPPGFRAVSRKDDRYNPRRGIRTASGDAQTDAIWTRTVPRRLVPAPEPARVAQVAPGALASPAEARAPYFIRLTSRSAPGAPRPGSVAPAALVRGGR